jgi:WG containing repeat
LESGKTFYNHGKYDAALKDFIAAENCPDVDTAEVSQWIEKTKHSLAANAKEVGKAKETNGIDPDVSVSSFSDGVASITYFDNGRPLLINKAGNRIAQKVRDDSSWSYTYSDGLVICVRQDRAGILDTNGVTIVPFKYITILPFSEGRAAVCNGKLWGFIDKRGNEIIKCQLSYGDFWNNPKMLTFSEGLLPFFGDHGFGFINTSGQTVIEPKYGLNLDAPYFSQGLVYVWYLVDRQEVHAFINQKGEEVFRVDETAGPFSDGLAALEPKSIIQYGQTKHFLGGYVDMNGKVVIPRQYSQVGNFSDGLALVADTNGRQYFIDTRGEKVIELKNYVDTRDFSEGMAHVSRAGKEGFIDKSGKEVIKCQYIFANDFSEGLALVMSSDKKYYFIDRTGKKTILVLAK